MPWFAWIAIAGIVVWGMIAVVSIWVNGSGDDDDGRLSALEARVDRLERDAGPRQT